jgi:hypothetical protein
MGLEGSLRRRPAVKFLREWWWWLASLGIGLTDHQCLNLALFHRAQRPIGLLYSGSGHAIGPLSQLSPSEKRLARARKCWAFSAGQL